MNRRRFIRNLAGMSLGMLFPGEIVRASAARPELGTGLFVPPAVDDASNTIYLTFDDGYVGLAEKIAAVNALGVVGTFFLTGQVIYQHPRELQLLLNSGHILGNHTYDHQNLTRLGPSGISSEIQRCESAALSTTGVSTLPLMRPPYGAVNATVRSVAAGLGYQSILWDWDTRDWAGTSASYIEQHVGAGIVLMHTQGLNTVAALYDIVPALGEQGYVFDVL